MAEQKMKTGADIFLETVLFLCKPLIFYYLGKIWGSGVWGKTVSKSLPKYKDYVLPVYIWYLPSEIPFTSSPLIKFVKDLQIASPKALPAFYVKGSDSWVETQGNVLHLDFHTCRNWGQSSFCLWLQGSSLFQSKVRCSESASGHSLDSPCSTSLVKASAFCEVQSSSLVWSTARPPKHGLSPERTSAC